MDRQQNRSAELMAWSGIYLIRVRLGTMRQLHTKNVQEYGIITDSLSVMSGAGRKAELDFLFVECNESIRPYGVPKHRHLSEIEQELSAAAAEAVAIQFTPHLIPVTRGILTTIYLAPERHF